MHVLVREHPVQSERVPRGFHGSAGSDVNTDHISPQSTAASIDLAGVGAGVGRARARARASCEPGLLCSVANTTTPLGQGHAPRYWSNSHEGWAQASSIPHNWALSSAAAASF